MHIGAVFPQTQIGADPGAVRAFAQAATDLGYDHLLAYDHVVGAIPALHDGFTGGYTWEHPFHEPLVLFGFLAAVCPLELVTGVLVLPQRQTVLVAKQAAEVDVLTGGRLRMGVGLGWNRVEYQALDMPFATRGARIEEQIELLRRLWTAPVEEFGGRFHGIRGAALVPRPVQQPIPIWMGANLGSPGLERVGRLADGWIVFRAQPGDQLDRDAERVLAAVTEAGRDPAKFGIQGRLTVDGQDPDTVRRQVESWRSFGATHLAIATTGELPRSPDEHIRTLAVTASAIVLGSRERRG
jgi:probable F420-dependent oxidoreductase